MVASRRVLLTGANGFIGAHLAAALIAAGYKLVGAVRDPAAFVRRFPAAEAIACEMNRDTSPDVWLPRLARIDAVVNCAGILQASRGQAMAAIHTAAPAALFEACQRAGIRRVVQISAISADPEAGTDYARSKRAADDYLRTLDLDWVVLRPSLVYASGSYGGTSLLRALAALPWLVPLVGQGEQNFQPIHAGDLGKTVLAALDRTDLARMTLDVAGPETLTMREILILLRGWLGFRPVRLLAVPMSLIRALCRIGDVTGAGPLSTTALRQLEYGNTGSASRFIDVVGFTPRTLSAALAAEPAQIQDRWHARLYFVRPLLTATLAALWLGSGIVGLVTPEATTHDALAALDLPGRLVPILGIGTSLMDIAIGAAIIGRGSKSWLGPLQLIIVAGYTALLTIALPSLWFDPFGPLLKNLPILGAVAAWSAMDDGR